MHFCKRYRYRFGDIDDAGIAYYPSFFHYFHGCFEDWWSDALDKPYHELMHDDHLGLPAVRVECDFLRPVRYGDAPLIHLGVRRIGTASVAFGFWMTPQEVGADPLCRAEVTTVAVDMRTMQKQPLPERWRGEFGRFLLEAGEGPWPLE